MARADSMWGIDCKVAIGEDQVLGMGDWQVDHMTLEVLEDSTAWEDDWETIEGGVLKGGGFSFKGLYKPNDTLGQDVLRTALENRTHLIDLRLYFNDGAHYLAPHQTTPASFALITSAPISADRGARMKCEFSGRISGKWNKVTA